MTSYALVSRQRKPWRWRPLRRTTDSACRGSWTRNEPGMTELTRLSAADIAAAIAAGEASAVEVATAHLDRVEAVNEKVNAFLYIDRDNALATARSIDERRAAGEKLGPLAGVPLALKDVFTQKNVPTTCGSKILEG